MLLVIASLFIVVPARDAVVEVDWVLGAGLVALGLFTGVMSGLLGIGGGVIVVPLLVVLVGASDLVAKGTSLLMVIATGTSGTIARSEEHTSELQSRGHLVCRLLLEKKNRHASRLRPKHKPTPAPQKYAVEDRTT